MIFILTLFSGLTLILFVLSISLFFMIFEERNFFKNNRKKEDSKTSNCSFTYHLMYEGHLPRSLFIACISQLIVSLFIPMGTLPQFISTSADIFIIVFLMLLAHGLYIRGVKSFSKDRYQSMENKEVNLLFNFAIVLLIVGGTFSWYILNRGLPGYIFSIDAYSAMPLWRVTGLFGKAGLVLFFILLSIASPGRKISRLCANGVIRLSDIFEAVSPTICSAIIVAMFMPHKIGIALGFTGVTMFTIDYSCFWIEVFFLQIIISPLIKNHYLKYKVKIPYNFNLLPAILVGLFGFLFMMMDLYL